MSAWLPGQVLGSRLPTVPVKNGQPRCVRSSSTAETPLRPLEGSSQWPVGLYTDGCLVSVFHGFVFPSVAMPLAVIATLSHSQSQSQPTRPQARQDRLLPIAPFPGATCEVCLPCWTPGSPQDTVLWISCEASWDPRDGVLSLAFRGSQSTGRIKTSSFPAPHPWASTGLCTPPAFITP
jgi:hypothetical protein